MGYDMQSKLESGDKGYFRLNIWGMGWMRSCILDGDASLEKELYRFCSNDGYVIGEALGKRIGAALRKYLQDNPVGSRLVTKRAPHEQAAADMFGTLTSILGAGNVQGAEPEEKTMTEEDADIIKDFATYNETMCPYEVW